MRALNTVQKIILFCGVLVIVAIGLASAWHAKKGSSPVSPPSGQATSTSQVNNPPPPQDAFPVYRGEPIQTLNPNAEFLKQVPPEVFEKSKTELAGLSEKLQIQSNSPSDWFRVAYIKHFYGDEIGARDAYLYLIAIKPDDAISIYNLAVLYGYHLKEPKRAIPYFERAIALDPRNESFYLGFADFYRDAEKNLVLSEKILLSGFTALPSSINLMSALAGNYVLMGRFDLAIAYYERVLATGGLTPSLRESVQAELNRLKANPVTR